MQYENLVTNLVIIYYLYILISVMGYIRQQIVKKQAVHTGQKKPITVKLL